MTVAVAALLSCDSPNSPIPPPGGGNGGGGDDSTGGDPPLDSIPPSTVTELTLTYSDTTGTARFVWTAPYDDTPSQPVDHYEIRMSFTRGFFPPDFWNLSIPVADPPPPAAPGFTQRITLTNLTKGRDLYVGIRSYDAAGNRSSGSALVSTRVPGPCFRGRCVDALTGVPIPGLRAKILAGPVFDLTTDANGEFLQDDLQPGGANVEIASTPAAPGYHRLSRFFVLENDTTYVFAMIPYQPTLSPTLGGMSLLSFFKSLTFTQRPPHILARWRRSPVPTYIPPFVNGNGVDYELDAKAAAQRWMDVTGESLFTFVSSPPDTGIVVSYRSPGEMGTSVAFTVLTVDGPGHPVAIEIRIRNNLIDPLYYKVMLHEFGHTIRLDHLASPEFIMFFGQPLPNDITPDEATVVRLHQSLPVRVNMSDYDESPPPFQAGSAP